MREAIFKRKQKEKLLQKRKTTTAEEKGKPEIEEVMSHENSMDFEGVTTDF